MSRIFTWKSQTWSKQKLTVTLWLAELLSPTRDALVSADWLCLWWFSCPVFLWRCSTRRTVCAATGRRMRRLRSQTTRKAASFWTKTRGAKCAPTLATRTTARKNQTPFATMNGCTLWRSTGFSTAESDKTRVAATQRALDSLLCAKNDKDMLKLCEFIMFFQFSLLNFVVCSRIYSLIWFEWILLNYGVWQTWNITKI